MNKFFRVLPFGLFLILTLCQSPSSRDNDKTESSSSTPATQVDIITAEVKTFEYFISASGTVGAEEEVEMQFKRQGLIKSLLIKNGQPVSKGQLLASLDKEKQELSLSKAQVAMREKKYAMNDRIHEFLIFKDSAKFKKIEENIYLTTGLAAAEIEYEEAKLEYENSFLRAEISGIVSGIEVKKGNSVSESDILCFIHSPQNLVVHALVLESDALQLKPGVIAEILVPSLTSPLNAKVTEINPRVDEKTGLVKVELRLMETSNVFPGMHVQVTMKIPFEKHIVIPKESLVIRAGKSVVFTMQKKQAKWNYVTTGKENGKQIEILSGINAGDSVIVSNNLQLAHDAKVSLNPGQ